MTELAIFLKSIGIDLKGEDKPYLKTIVLKHKVKKTLEKRVNGKTVSEEIEVDEEYRREYHIFPYSEMKNKFPSNSIEVIGNDCDIGLQIANYLKNLFNATAYKKPEPFNSSQLSGFH